MIRSLLPRCQAPKRAHGGSGALRGFWATFALSKIWAAISFNAFIFLTVTTVVKIVVNAAEERLVAALSGSIHGSDPHLA